MQNKFSTSINIVRDIAKEINYITTPNAQNIFNQLINDYQTGLHAFNIIGSYGTGKSAFLLALIKTLNGQQNYFDITETFFKEQAFTFLNIIGTYRSFIEVLGQELNIETPTNQGIFKALDIFIEEHKANNTTLIIIVDEFGKHLEYAAKNKPELELYFIQQLAEYITDKPIILLTTLHQNFASYARHLNEQQQNEWVKVKGRLKELTFNEPVEQLLGLAANYLATQNFAKPNLDFNALFKLLEKANAVPLNSKISLEVAKKLLPFDLLSAAILTLALQKYGQNERSLFTFLNSKDLYSLQSFNQKQTPYYNLSAVYDYLQYNFYSFLNTKFNPHYVQWRAVQKAIERIEGVITIELIPNAIQLIKIIGLLNIFASEGARLDKTFLVDYVKYTLGIDIDVLIDELSRHKIIRYKKYKNQYLLFEGTDIDIETKLLEASKEVVRKENIVFDLQKHFSLPYVSAKAVYYQKGTPRFFEYELSAKPIRKQAKGQIDGFINLVFPIVKQGETETSLQDVMTFSSKTTAAIIYAYFTHHTTITNVVYAINKIEYLLNQQEIREDRIAKRELEDLKYFEIQELNNLVFNYLFDKSHKVVWIYAGKVLAIDSRTKFNKQLSVICDDVYFGTPTFRNELMNREKISGSISTARKNYFKRLLQDWKKANIGFENHLFPAEKTIYLTLLQQTGIHRQISPIHYELGKPLAESFQLLWQAGETFLESGKHSQRPLLEFEQILYNKPFKLKKGFVDFWLPSFLFIKRNDYALFRNGEYVPYFSAGELDVMYRKLDEYKIKTFNVEGVRLDLFNKYRELLEKDTLEVATEASFIETVKPFLSFYGRLPQYTKQTKRLAHHTLQFREAIRTATDPEQTFFEVFPRALGFHNLDLLKKDASALSNYITYLQTALRELRTAYDNLLDRVEAFIVSELGYEGQSFEAYKKGLRDRYKSIKKHLLLPYQKVFYVRLDSQIEERNDWLNNMVSGVLRKSLRDISDEEEVVLYEKLSATFQELDNLCDIHKIEINRAKEEVVKIEITSLDAGTKPYQVRLNKRKLDEAEVLESKIRPLLSKDASINKRVLIKLLQEILD